MAQAKLDQTKPEDVIADKKLMKGNLREIVAGMKNLLQPFQYNIDMTLKEENGILVAINFEINIKNVR
jgi:hypothetical protein